MFAEDLQHIGQQRDAGAKENEADEIERIRFFAVIGQMQIDQDQAGEADGKIHEEDDPPVKVSDDEAAGDRSEHWADQTRDGDEAHGADELVLGERAHDGEASDGHHHGASAALQDAAGHQYVDVGR